MINFNNITTITKKSYFTNVKAQLTLLQVSHHEGVLK